MANPDNMQEVFRLVRNMKQEMPNMGELVQRLDRIEAQSNQMYPHVIAQRDATNSAVVAGLSTPSTRNAKTVKKSDHTQAFTNFLRNSRDPLAKGELWDVQAAATGGTGSAGGFLIPTEIVDPLMMRARATNPLRDLVRVITVGSRDVKLPLSNADASASWVGELATRAATTRPSLTSAAPTFGTLYSLVASSEELVQDSQFDIASWFAEEAGAAMGEAEMSAIISGDGSDKPSGLLKVAPEAVADGTRTAGALKYIATGAASNLGTAFTDTLVSMVYDVKAQYRSRGTWVMNSTVASEVRKLKDTTGRFLWTDSLSEAQPATLLGFPVAIAESMGNVQANAFPIAFGDFARGYVLAENEGLRITIDDNVTLPGQVRWYLRRRLGGCVYDNNAVRVLKVAAS